MIFLLQFESKVILRAKSIFLIFFFTTSDVSEKNKIKIDYFDWFMINQVSTTLKVFLFKRSIILYTYHY